MRRRYVQVNGELVEVGVISGKPRQGPDVMPDIQPYKSMIDGSTITSRSKHREHLKAHGCVEVGNEAQKIADNAFKNIPDVAPQQRHEVIRAQVDSMRHSEFQAMLRRDLERIRWNSRKD